LITLRRLLPSSRRYLDPTGRYVARFATHWRRGVAAAIDWALCYVAFLLVSIPLGTVLGAMLGVHTFIGIGEAVITVGAVALPLMIVLALAKVRALAGSREDNRE